MIGHHTPTHTLKTHTNQMRPMSGCVHIINVKVFHVCTQSMMTQADVITLHELHGALKEILCVSWHFIDQSTNQFVKNISYKTITRQLKYFIYIYIHTHKHILTPSTLKMNTSTCTHWQTFAKKVWTYTNMVNET